MSYTFLINCLCLVYPVKEPLRSRDRPLEVLALGLSRSGTDSLRQALVKLGYIDTYHGYNDREWNYDSPQWMRLAFAKHTGNTKLLTAEEFDKNLGDCMAVTDLPCAWFGHELTSVYPDTKVILNYREDLDAWSASCENTIEAAIRWTWYEWILSFFQPQLFWEGWVVKWLWRKPFGNDFRKHSKRVYREHYRQLEDSLPAERVLRWKVEDGWEPLCKFLEKPVPAEPFPNGNTPKAFHERIGKLTAARKVKAERNFHVFVGTLVVFLVVAGYLFAAKM